VKHFHEHIRKQHGFRWGYTWTKTQLHTARLVERAARRGANQINMLGGWRSRFGRVVPT